ncbi:MAG TPA: hypothetical protein VG755_01720, partial [Nannocystaceae bacterium]|nr:hypothetical protein [Nannocystaceae bacterium]
MGRRGLLFALAGSWACGGGESQPDPTWVDFTTITDTVGSHEDDDTAGESSSVDVGDSSITIADESSSSTGSAPTDFDPTFALAQVDAALAAGVPGLAIAIV